MLLFNSEAAYGGNDRRESLTKVESTLSQQAKSVGCLSWWRVGFFSTLDRYLVKHSQMYSTYEISAYITFTNLLYTLGPQKNEKWRFYTPKYGL